MWVGPAEAEGQEGGRGEAEETSLFHLPTWLWKVFSSADSGIPSSTYRQIRMTIETFIQFNKLFTKKFVRSNHFFSPHDLDFGPNQKKPPILIPDGGHKRFGAWPCCKPQADLRVRISYTGASLTGNTIVAWPCCKPQADLRVHISYAGASLTGNTKCTMANKKWIVSLV